MIFAGPSAPKFIAEAWVASEKVGEGGPGEEVGFEEPNASGRSERGRRGAMYCKSTVAAVAVCKEGENSCLGA